MRLYSVFDKKASVYKDVVSFNFEADCLRYFSSVVNDGRSMYAEFPEDFALYQVGCFDEQSGLLNCHIEPEDIHPLVVDVRRPIFVTEFSALVCHDKE